MSPPRKLALRPGRLASTALAAVVAAFVLSACGGSTPMSGDVRPGPADREAISVVAYDNVFEPTTLALEPGSEVALEVTNRGDQAHNLVIEEVDLSTGTLESGDVVAATFAAPDETLTFYCSFHPGMTGTVEPATG